MSPERTGEDPSPEDAPDWFEAEEEGDTSADPAPGDHDWLDDVAPEGWFEDPDHRPIDTGTGATDEPGGAESAPGDVFDEESGAPGETAGATESTAPAGAGASEPRAHDTAVTTDEPGTGANRDGTPENTPGAVAPTSGPNDGGTDTPGEDERETGETAETGEAEDAGSYVHRVLAWLRSVVGRLV